jgi:hypothetical protein
MSTTTTATGTATGGTMASSAIARTVPFGECVGRHDHLIDADDNGLHVHRAQ